MSHLLWQYFLENDVHRFKYTLAKATLNTSAQTKSKGGNSGPSTSPGNILSTSPTVTKNRKSHEKSQTPAQGSRASKRDDTITMSRADINWRDAHGCTLLHYIASSSNAEASQSATALLQLPMLDIYIQDDESGWTPLHRALYNGNTTIATALLDRDINDAMQHTSAGFAHTAGGLIKIKDHEGFSPFDVYGTTIANRVIHHANQNLALGAGLSNDEDNEMAQGVSGDADEERQSRQLLPQTQIGGDEMFAFGSNKNFTLGFGDEDDRQYPERVYLKRPDHLMYKFYEDYKASLLRKPRRTSNERRSKPFGIFELPAAVRYRPLTVQDIQLSKLSSAILTNDPEANLYVCGFGSGGRLGTGDETTRFSYVNIGGGGLATKRVIQVTLGQNHTIAVTNDGETYTWGSNAFGQLGYASNANVPGLKDEDTVQLLPRQVFGPLKREIIVGAAASRIHSAVITTTSLYTFGKNEGQMGLVDSDARSLLSQNTPRKVGASLFTSPIRTVSAIEKATICLLDSHEVLVFANYGYTKVVFQVENTRFLQELGQGNSRFSESRPSQRGNQVCKIAAGGDTLCALTEQGDVFTRHVTQNVETSIASSSTTNPSKIRGALSPSQHVWSLKKAHMAVRDVDVGQDGSIIICTESGSVWRRIKRAKIKDAATSKPSDYKAKDYKFSRVPGLTRIVAVRSNTFGAYAAVRRDCDVLQTQVDVDAVTLWKDLYPLLPFHGFGEEDSDTEDPQPRFWRSSQPNDIATIRRAVITSRNLEHEMTAFLAERKSSNEGSYDLQVASTVSDVRIPVHAFMFAGRSSVMDKALTTFQREYFFSIPEIASIEYDCEGKPVILFQGIDFITLINLVLYVYTDSVVDVWQFRRSQELAFRYRQVRVELMKVASALDLRKLEHAVRLMTEPPKTLNDDFESAIESSTFFDNGDIEIELDGSSQKVHGPLVCARCPFFEGLFQGRAGGRWLSSRRDEDQDVPEPVEVDLSHVNPDVFKYVMRHIYADTDERMFDNVVTADLDAYLDLIIEVMSVANELMLDRLTQSCQKILGRYVNTRNVCQLLNAVAPCSVTEFKDAALEYICLNLESMLENHLLGELDSDLMLELDGVVRQNQLNCMPFAKSGKAEADMIEQYPGLIDRFECSKQIKVDRVRLHARLQEKENKVGGAPKTSHDLLEDFEHSRISRKSPGLAPRANVRSPNIERKSSAQDLMFDMDGLDEDHTERASTRAHVTDRESSRALSSPEQTPTGKLSALHLTDAAASTSPSSYGALASSLEPVAEVNVASNTSQPWAKASLSTSKVDMKAILAQASSSGQSSIANALAKQERRAQTAKSATPVKLSQKERKRHQQEQMAQVATLSAQPCSPILEAKIDPQPKPASPWQGASSGPKVSLKEVLGEKNKPQPVEDRPSPSSSPSMTLRQTVAGKSASRRPPGEPPSTLPAQTQRSVSSPSTSTVNQPRQSPFPPPRSLSTYTPPVPSQPPAIRSIRHDTSPSAAEPSLQLSMSDILALQQTEKDVIRDAVAKRSLQEIQEEQAFQEWWDEESRKVQLEKEEEDARKKGRIGPARRGRSRGGRGRGAGGKGKESGGGERSKGDGGERSTRAGEISSEGQKETSGEVKQAEGRPPKEERATKDAGGKKEGEMRA